MYTFCLLGFVFLKKSLSHKSNCYSSHRESFKGQLQFYVPPFSAVFGVCFQDPF